MTTPSSRKPRVTVSARNPHFFKVFLPHLSSQNLRIPPKFRKHIDEEESPVTVSLKGPSGRIWRVELTKNSDGMFFDNGWNGFVTDHSLVLGDFLVFRYDGKLVFDVMVFDTTACEKDEAFVAVPCQDGIIVLDTDDDGEEAAPKALVVARNGSVRVSLKRSRGNDDLQKKLSGIARKKRCDHQPWIFRKSKTSPHSTKVMNSRALVARSSSSSKKSRPARPKKENQIVDAKEKHKDKISQRRPITEKPSRAQENSNSFKSRNPFCKIEMTHTYVHQGFFMEAMRPVDGATSLRWVPIDHRRRLGSFRICALCTCCGGPRGLCLPSPCCYTINCNIPNRPFGFCSFTPKTCNCFGCHL